MIFIDASFFVSLFLDTDPNYLPAIKEWNAITDEKVTSEDIIKETLTIISQRINKAGSIVAYHKITDLCTILPASSERYQAGLDLFLNPELQKDVSCIDCISAALCREFHIKRILSFDEHFKQFGLSIVP